MGDEYRMPRVVAFFIGQTRAMISGMVDPPAVGDRIVVTTRNGADVTRTVTKLLGGKRWAWKVEVH